MTYFDYNATAPARPEAVEAMTAAMSEAGNPSSMHAAGRRARRLLDEARERIAGALGAQARQVVFTSGATEANNLVLRGFAAAHPGGTIATTEIDHASILATADALAGGGYRVVRLPVDSGARPQALATITDRRDVLLSTGLANGESGHVADVDMLAAALPVGGWLHLDAAQALGKIPVRIDARIHFLTLSSHKLGGPHGIGALIVNTDAPALAAQITGGPQERALRAGTENVEGAVGMGVAVELATRERAREAERLRALREKLWGALSMRLDRLLRISPQDGLPNTLTVAVAGLGADVVVAALDLAGFAVSAGSACAAGAPEPSHVMRAFAIDEIYRDGVVRLSLGRLTTADDVARLADAFGTVVARAREAA